MSDIDVAIAIVRDADAEPAHMRQYWVDARVCDAGQYEAHQLADALARLDKVRLQTADPSRISRVPMEMATIKTMTRWLQEAAGALEVLTTRPETPEDIGAAAAARYPELLQLLTVPVVIISIGSRASRHGVPPSRLARELSGRATVWALPTPEMSRHLGARPELETYGGAVRVVGRPGWSTVIRTNRGAETAIRRTTQAVVDAAAADLARPKLTLVPDFAPDGVAGLEVEPARDMSAEQAAQGAREEAARLEREIQRLRGALSSAEQEVQELRAQQTPPAQESEADGRPVFADDE